MRCFGIGGGISPLNDWTRICAVNFTALSSNACLNPSSIAIERSKAIHPIAMLSMATIRVNAIKPRFFNEVPKRWVR